MAIKDWQKQPNDTLWVRKDDKFSFVRVWKVGLPASERKRRGINTYGVMTRIGRSGVQRKRFFKKKSQALASARAFMRKN